MDKNIPDGVCTPMRIIPYNFRWPLRQVGDREIECMIPLGNADILHPKAIELFGLSDRESADAEYAALREIALKP
jgi:hypothetical protein